MHFNCVKINLTRTRITQYYIYLYNGDSVILLSLTYQGYDVFEAEGTEKERKRRHENVNNAQKGVVALVYMPWKEITHN